MQAAPPAARGQPRGLTLAAVVGGALLRDPRAAGVVFAWGLYMWKGLAFWSMAALEGLWLLLTALWLLRGFEVGAFLQIALAGVTLLALFVGRAARAAPCA